MKWLINFLRRLFVGRPKLHYLDNGVISFKEIEKVKYDRIIEFIKNMDKQPEVVIPQPVLETLKVEQDFQPFPKDISNPVKSFFVSNECTEKTFGLSRDNSGNYFLVSVRFNTNSREAYIDEVKDYKKEKSVAVSDFKMALMKLGIV